MTRDVAWNTQGAQVRVTTYTLPTTINIILYATEMEIEYHIHPLQSYLDCNKKGINLQSPTFKIANGKRKGTWLGSKLGMILGMSLGSVLPTQFTVKITTVPFTIKGTALGTELGNVLGVQLGTSLGMLLGMSLGTSLGAQFNSSILCILLANIVESFTNHSIGLHIPKNLS